MQSTQEFPSILKRPLAFIPVAMSLAAFALVLGHIAIFGAVREADEGATAHIFQLLIALQAPVVLFFLIQHLPKAPRETVYVLALQAGAVLAAMAPVFYFHL